MKSGIYKIVHLASGRCYIGQSLDVAGRIKKHIQLLSGKRHIATHLQHCWDKYGPEAFSFQIIELCSIGLLNEREQFWIDNSKSEFNHSRMAGSTRGTIMSDEQKEKLRQANLGKKMPGETKLKISAANKGRGSVAGWKHTEEVRRKMSLSRAGHQVSEETRTKISLANKGRKRSAQVRAQMSESRLRYLRENGNCK